MREYSVAKVVEDMGFANRIDKLTTVKARNYDEAVEKARRKLRLKTGDELSIIALGGKRTAGPFGRWTYTI